MFNDLGYLPSFILILIAIILAIIALILPVFLAPYNQNNAKKNHYECGVSPKITISYKFYIKFYIIAILFILLDVEISFLIPWAVGLRYTMYDGLFSMIIFSFFLLIGIIYEIKNEVLEW